MTKNKKFKSRTKGMLCMPLGIKKEGGRDKIGNL